MAGVAALGMSLGGADARADPVDVPTPGTAAVAPGPAGGPTPAGLMGVEPLRPDVLAGERGGTEVHNDMLSQGYVSDNQAVNVTTGANFITEGSFSNAGGVPMVVQNTGNNVLIQNSTILNIQVQ
ncbi:hypothetical protein LOC51_16895 [Rubrivivax sp. JA1024]|nr:hypothetical protein [Rubrivivax sp. JA1024]